jgi:hypothetical protein
LAQALALALATVVQGQTYISEVLVNPPGSDLVGQYIELRGQPNSQLPDGTYFLAVNGDAESNPGTIRNIFDLSRRAIGGNGFLLLLQNSNSYTFNSMATVVVNTNGPGWGTASGSSIGHRGKSGSVDLPHASVTFFLIQTTNPPAIDDDIDPNNDGLPNGPIWAGWKGLDSVGMLDNDGAGDIAYGRINFRRDAAPGSGATAKTNAVSIVFTPDYVARTGNTVNYQSTSWVVGANLLGTAPNWRLSDGDTAPATYDLEPLDNRGGPNFYATPLAGVVAVSPAGGMVLTEGGASSSYRLGLNTAPAGAVTVQATAESSLEISLDGGSTWGVSRSLSFTDTTLQTVSVRASIDNVVDTSPHSRAIRHAIVNTLDTAKYPTSALTPVVWAAILETQGLLLSELKVNPPGTNDGPWEYVEIAGPPNALLTNVFFLSLESDGSKDPGKVNLVINLSSIRLGSSGLLVIGATNNPYAVPAGAAYLGQARFNDPDGALGNGSRTFLLVSSAGPFTEGDDLDKGDNGILEGLPPLTTVLDSVAFSDGNALNVFYSSAVLALPGATPDAAARFPANKTPQSLAAWFYGDLSGPATDSLFFDSTALSTNFPAGAVLSPGRVNDISVTITGLGPLSGVVGDPTNPGLSFTVADANSPDPASLGVVAASSNPLVVPAANLTVVAGAGGRRTLYLNPIGVGFSTITITVAGSSAMGRISFPYAASDMGRPGGFFHTGASDASGAVAVDASYMMVGDDENPIVRLYDRRRSGPPLWQIDFRPYLNVSGQNAGEVDIEGSTRVGNRFFWTGSHAHNNLAENRTNRMRFFASDLVGSGTNARLEFVGFYEYLKDDLLAWDRGNGHGKGANYYGLTASAADQVDPKTPYGFNIEGLCMAPGSAETAYLAFRAPIVSPTNRTYALIVPVLNFATLAAQGGPLGSCRFGAPIELDLYGRGIRAIEGSPSGYLIVGGNPGDGNSTYPLDFKLYTWTGQPGDQPQQRAADLTGMRPEALVETPPSPWTDSTSVQLLSDIGSAVIYNDGVANKHAAYPAFKKSRSDWVTLGPIVKPAPIILSTRRNASTLTLTWRALKGEVYAVQSAIDLAAAAWSDLPGDVTAGGPYASKEFAPPVAPQCFYRVVVR